MILNSWGFLCEVEIVQVAKSHLLVIKCDDGHTIALSSTVKCDGVTMYHLSVGIYENGYPFTHKPTNK